MSVRIVWRWTWFPFVSFLFLGIAFAVGAQSGRNRSTSPPVVKPNVESKVSAKSPPPLPSGEPSGPVFESDDVIRVEATLVSVPVVVGDADGRYLPFLKQQQFRLYEDGVTQDISFFAPERVPFHVALVLDTSGSTFLSISDIQDAAVSFINQLREDDQVAVITFAGDVEVLSDFTNNRGELRRAVRQIRSGGSTKLYEAVYQTVRFMRGIEGRKAMILMTDGEDTSSKRGMYRRAIDAVVESDILTYVVQYPTGGNIQINGPRTPGRFPMPTPWPWPRNPRPFSDIAGPVFWTPPQGRVPTRGPSYSQETFLSDLTRATGGQLFVFNSMGSLSDVFARIAEELRHVYVLGYYPTNSLDNGGFRRLRVEVDEPGAKVRAREGYHAKSPNKPASADGDFQP